jgi:hypothetical protein
VNSFIERKQQATVVLFLPAGAQVIEARTNRVIIVVLGAVDRFPVFRVFSGDY